MVFLYAFFSMSKHRQSTNLRKQIIKQIQTAATKKAPITMQIQKWISRCHIPRCICVLVYIIHVCVLFMFIVYCNLLNFQVLSLYKPQSNSSLPSSQSYSLLQRLAPVMHRWVTSRHWNSLAVHIDEAERGCVGSIGDSKTLTQLCSSLLSPQSSTPSQSLV